MAVTNDLETDRRVARHAAALHEAGYEVTVVGRLLEESHPIDCAWHTHRMQLRHRSGWRFYAEYNRRLLSWLLHEHNDIVWANDTDTLPASWLAARLTGARLVMDAHELFPEVPELQGRQRVKRVWTAIERRLMPRCDAHLTVCQSIADYYKQLYGIEMTVVRNLNADTQARGAVAAAEPPVLLYQGAVNEGRGVDWAIDAMGLLPECRLVVAGGGDKLEEMRRYAQAKEWNDRIEFVGRLLPDELAQLTRRASVGLVMLEDKGLSYHFALPNRVGDFVAAGVPMVVSDLPEMAAVVRRFGVGAVIEQPGAEGLTKAVRQVMERKWSEADFAEARADMDWNKEKKKLLTITEKL